MGILDRLGNLARSYLSDADLGKLGSAFKPRPHTSGNPDLDAAYEELDAFLKGEGARSPEKDSSWHDWADIGSGRRPQADSTSRDSAQNSARSPRPSRPVPPEVAAAFAELALAPGTPLDDCKAAYKKLLKIHHPDRHAGHPGNMKKATEKTARLNAAMDKLEKWYAP